MHGGFFRLKAEATRVGATRLGATRLGATKLSARRMGLLALCCLAATATKPVPTDPMHAFPRRVLWAWERPEELSSIDTTSTAVAVLDRTIQFTEAAAHVHYRQHALKVPASATLIAVVRLEGNAVWLDDDVRARIVQDAVAAAARRRIRALQIDFDATASQRELYRQLLGGIRVALPPHLPLSMTALPSWCADPEWLDALPVDEVVPMAFEMGADRDRVVRQLARGEAFRARTCRRSIGVSLDEPVDVSGYRRRYVFSHRGWNGPALAAALW
jgi:Protein of unknown function (DUF3142)